MRMGNVMDIIMVMFIIYFYTQSLSPIQYTVKYFTFIQRDAAICIAFINVTWKQLEPNTKIINYTLNFMSASCMACDLKCHTLKQASKQQSCAQQHIFCFKRQ